MSSKTSSAAKADQKMGQHLSSQGFIPGSIKDTERVYMCPDRPVHDGKDALRIDIGWFPGSSQGSCYV